MSSSLNRALQVRIANRLRATLARDAAIGLPVVDSLSEADQRELCDMGGGRLAAIAIRSAGDAAAVMNVVRSIEVHVRRTDLLACMTADTLMVFSPGLDPVAGRALATRLQDLLVALPGAQVTIGAAYRSPASPAGWTAASLAAEAVRSAVDPVALAPSA